MSSMAGAKPWTEAEFRAETHVSRETLADYAVWNDLLIKWNKRINLVAPGEVPQFWHRHAYDSWQLTQHLSQDWEKLVDLGSGGGFPGLALGIHAKAQGRGQVHLVESVGKKINFLKTVTRACVLPVTCHAARVEALAPLEADIITARAFAPLPRLFDYASRHLKSGGILLLPKGESADKEIEDAHAEWTFDVERLTSLTQDTASLLRITQLQARS